MHIVYIDDSGDEQVRVFSCLAIPAQRWNDCFAQIQAFRRKLKQRDGIFVKLEFHATDFVSGRGHIADRTIPKGARCRIFKETLFETTQLPGVRLFNGAAAKQDEPRLFERLLNRINRTAIRWDSQAILVSDEGKDYTALLRKMRVYNPIPSMFGGWQDGNLIRNIVLDRIIEDIFFRRSERSYFIQLADFCAYALLRSERPIPSKSRYGLDGAFDLLRGICTPECFGSDPRRLGIIRAT